MPDYPEQIKFQDGIDYDLIINKAPVEFNHQKYGQQFIYNFTYNDGERTYFASPGTHKKLQVFPVGTKIRMGKHKDGDYWKFQIEALGNASKEEMAAQPDLPPPPRSHEPDAKNWDMINAKNNWFINKATAMKGAVELAKKVEEVEGIYHDIFALLRTDTALVIDQLRRCESLESLELMWKSEAQLWNEILGSEKMGIVQGYKEKFKSSFNPPAVEDPDPPLPF